MTDGWVINPRDGMPEKLGAKAECPTCRGHGLVDAGHYACMLIPCPACFPGCYQEGEYEELKRQQNFKSR